MSRFLVPMIPGPVIGLVALLLLLLLRGRVPQHIDTVGSVILQNLGLLFVPASVGVVMYLPILQRDAIGVACALLVSAVAGLAVTGLVCRALGSRVQPGDEHAD